MQHQYIKGNECGFFKTKRFAAISHGVAEVGTGPVEDRHEIIGHCVDAAGGKVADRLLVVLDVFLMIARLCFDGFMHRHAFHHTPRQTHGFYFLFPFVDLFFRPYFTIGNMVEGCHHAGAAGLFDVPEAYRVFGPVPAHGLFHQVAGV